ncbi:hypothetical protein SprV_0100341900 [Sparganum proliferum]
MRRGEDLYALLSSVPKADKLTDLECPCPVAVDQRHLYHSCSNIRDDDDDDDDVRYFSHSATSQNTLDDPSAIIPTVAAPIRGDVDLVSTLKKKKKKKKKKTRSPGQELY